MSDETFLRIKKIFYIVAVTALIIWIVYSIFAAQERAKYRKFIALPSYTLTKNNLTVLYYGFGDLDTEYYMYGDEVVEEKEKLVYSYGYFSDTQRKVGYTFTSVDYGIEYIVIIYNENGVFNGEIFGIVSKEGEDLFVNRLKSYIEYSDKDEMLNEVRSYIRSIDNDVLTPELNDI